LLADAKIDDLDRSIISNMRDNPRVPAKTLARLLGVTEQTVAARLRGLRERNLMRVVVQSDVYALGYEFVCFGDVFVSDRASSDVAEDLQAVPGVTAVVLTFGAPEIIVMFVAYDRFDFIRIVNEDMGNVAGVDHVETLISMDIAKYETEYARLFDA
jgi:DNA-binding Lrp family transcriptional regulator